LLLSQALKSYKVTYGEPQGRTVVRIEENVYMPTGPALVVTLVVGLILLIIIWQILENLVGWVVRSIWRLSASVFRRGTGMEQNADFDTGVGYLINIFLIKPISFVASVLMVVLLYFLVYR
jgi:hypothetical protein